MKITRARRIWWTLMHGEPREWLAREEVAAALPVAVVLATAFVWVLWKLGEL